VGGPHRCGVRQGSQAEQGGVLGPGQLVAAICAEQVGAGGRSDDQRPAGEHPDRGGAVADQERQVLVGVSRRGQRLQGEPAHVHLVTVNEPVVMEPAVTRRRGQDRRAVLGGQLAGAGQEVRVQVGVRRVRHT
jgi:hypothetical protein